MAKEYQKNELFESISDPDYVLTAHDRMRRINSMGGPASWFPMPEFDVGQKRGYFFGGGFIVERRINLADYPEGTLATISYVRGGHTPALALCRYENGTWVTYEEPGINLLQDDKDRINNVWVLPDSAQNDDDDDNDDNNEEELTSQYLDDIEELRQGFHVLLSQVPLTQVQRCSFKAFYFFANKRAVQLGGEDVLTPNSPARP
jgi:hypothetical protein